MGELTQAPNAELRVATVHVELRDLLREFGLEAAAVVGRHGIQPKPSQSKKTIDQLRESNAEADFSGDGLPVDATSHRSVQFGVEAVPLSDSS
ncbi:hypothetical protein ACXX9E_29555 [Pseudomonas sp. GNP014]